MNALDSSDVAARYLAGESSKAIGDSLGLHDSTIRRRLVKFGIKPRRAGHAGLPGATNPNWKGGRCIKAGYVFVRVSGRQVQEHRIIAGAREAEVVHHKNHDPSDNNPSNLEIYSSHSAHMKMHMTPNEARRRANAGLIALSCICGKQLMRIGSSTHWKYCRIAQNRVLAYHASLKQGVR